jgi:hypothetical protein
VKAALDPERSFASQSDRKGYHPSVKVNGTDSGQRLGKKTDAALINTLRLTK